jgi:hypothetical protein
VTKEVATNEAFDRFHALAKRVVNVPKERVDALAKELKRKKAVKAG